MNNSLRKNYPLLLKLVLFTALLLLLLFVGCAKRGSRLSADGVTVDWQRAMDLFQRERYYRAQALLRDITLNYSGSAIIDSAYFYLGRTSFELNDYLVAADEFNRVVTRFPSSALAGDAAFYEALSYYKMAPSYQLDQQYMTQSFDAFQRYLEDHSDHVLKDSAYVYMAKAREQLGKKQYIAAELYFQIGEYASAILYGKAVLDNYYDTSHAESAQFLIGKCYFKLKDWTRAREEFESYQRRFPDGRYFVRAQEYVGRSLDRAARDASRKDAALSSEVISQ